MFFISNVVVFSLIHLAPGDPIEIMFATSGRPYSPEVMEEIRQSLGLDQPLHIQYFKWLGDFLRGDLGYSFVSRQPISSMISDRIWLTMELMLFAEIIALSFAVTLGVLSAAKQYSTVDYMCSIASLFMYSMPSFWIALIMIMLFSVWLGWLPVFGAFTTGVKFTFFEALIDHLRHLVLPVAAVSCVHTAYLFRLTRSAMIEILGEDYITTARAKGLKERVVIYKHALKNALLPTVTFVGISVGFVLGGAVVVETVFSWPGLGKLALDFAISRDYPGIMGLTMTIAVIVILANLCTDIAYALIDPRIRY